MPMTTSASISAMPSRSLAEYLETMVWYILVRSAAFTLSVLFEISIAVRVTKSSQISQRLCFPVKPLKILRKFFWWSSRMLRVTAAFAMDYSSSLSALAR